MNIVGGVALIGFGIVVMVFGDRRLLGKTVSYYSWEPWHGYGRIFLGIFLILSGLQVIFRIRFPFN
jgi:hypothetical protein